MAPLDLPIPDMIDYVDFRVTFTINGQPYIQPADDPMINDTYQKLPMNLPTVSSLFYINNLNLKTYLVILTPSIGPHRPGCLRSTSPLYLLLRRLRPHQHDQHDHEHEYDDNGAACWTCRLLLRDTDLIRAKPYQLKKEDFTIRLLKQKDRTAVKPKTRRQ